MIGYGAIAKVEATATSETVTEEKYNGSRPVYQETRYTELMRVKDESSVIGELLKLIDRHKSGDIHDFGIRCVTDAGGNLLRVEKTWSVKQLR